MNMDVPGLAAAVMFTCSMRSSSQFMGCAAAHCAFAFDQSKSTIDHPFVDCGSVKPVLLHTMRIVLEFICHV